MLNRFRKTLKIRNYLKKTLAVRQDMRDFFEDQQRDRNYDENKAEIIDELAKTVDNGQDENKSKNEEMMDLLKAIIKQNDNMKKEIDSLKKKLEDGERNRFVE